jgi:hypothetical protein
VDCYLTNGVTGDASVEMTNLTTVYPAHFADLPNGLASANGIVTLFDMISTNDVLIVTNISTSGGTVRITSSVKQE